MSPAQAQGRGRSVATSDLQKSVCIVVLVDEPAAIRGARPRARISLVVHIRVDDILDLIPSLNMFSLLMIRSLVALTLDDFKLEV